MVRKLLSRLLGKMFKGFEAHGTLKVENIGRILRVEGTGPWNLESLKSSGQDAQPEVDNLKGKPWGVMVILHGESIYVPAAAEKLTAIVAEERLQGRVATALLVNDCFAPNFAKEHLGEIYDKAGERYEFFDDIELAEAWLNQKISEAN